MKSLNQYILEQACNFRCGISLPFQKVKMNFCDIPNLYNYSVPEDTIDIWKTASGAISFNENEAIMGAIGESLERYSSAICDFELKEYNELKRENILPYSEFSLFSSEQYESEGFLWKKPDIKKQLYGKMYSLYDNNEIYIPQELIGLGSKVNPASLPSTSTGIAAYTSIYQAIYSALLELLERDALTVYWENSLGGREIKLDEKYLEQVKEKYGQVYCFDVTQDWNPFPVVMVCGYILSENKKIISMGVACRETYENAIEKAYIEWVQGCVFARFYNENNKKIKIDNQSDVVDFDLHAVYYTKYPKKWDDVPLIKDRIKYQYEEKNLNFKDKKVEKKIEFLLKVLKKENIRLYYKDLTSVDVKSIGVSVVRVVSPDLSIIHADENAPFLGGRTSDVKWRYKNLKQGKFPNDFPHPLG